MCWFVAGVPMSQTLHWLYVVPRVYVHYITLLPIKLAAVSDLMLPNPQDRFIISNTMELEEELYLTQNHEMKPFYLPN